MARRIYQRESTNFHLKAARRHIRLAKKQKGAEKFALQIQPFQLALISKHETTLRSLEKREDAYDDIQLADNQLDDCIRTTYETIRQYDRNNMAQGILLKVFSQGTFSEVVNMHYTQEPAEAERIATLIESLGTTHPLFALVAPLREAIAAVNSAIATYKESITALVHVQVEEEIAKAELRQQYEYNYLDARRELGVKQAENIFPSFSSNDVDKEEDLPSTQTGAA